ncbi:hypothetical protein [Senegalia massiliensis]|uniref:Uncharacterized protein n=1 Tax=Senegalia massiliensis TaxID=1720316 RepID=A0A845QZM3_9CLOT|nr:hypothetical protein [Senegalia massiliensis]NBI07620.1 hypothetical protein [Senegalia massiliensis]
MYREYNPEVSKEKIFNDYIYLSISKNEVENEDFTKVDKVFKILDECRFRSRGKLTIGFEGYIREIEEVYEIEEIRNYVSTMFSKYPYMFYYITSEELNNAIILSCIADVRLIYKGEKKAITELKPSENPTSVGLDIKLTKELKEKIIVSICKYAEKVGDTPENTEEHLLKLFPSK